MLPLRIVVEDVDAARVAAKRADPQRGYSSVMMVVWTFLALANFWLGFAEGRRHGDISYDWQHAFFGLAYLVFAALQFRTWRPAVPTAATITDDGIVFQWGGSARDRSYPWRSISSVIKRNDAFVITLRPTFNHLWNRSFFVPKPADAETADAVWSVCYQHLVASRALRATPLDRLGVINNSLA
jgi:hypothetical protein